ncbi:MAG TPA: YajG family lipoprotein [Candidatus Baltobacteraceae bacterium]|nr:YajG family lipoprotein [Candidatus Baltobacteraceae bacterium]
MKTKFTLFLRLAGSVLMIALLSGCALTEAKIPLAYQPQKSGHLTGAENVKVTVDLIDQRDSKDAVGHKVNTYGMEMAAIVATNDVAEVVKHAIEIELVNRGFNLTTNDAIHVEITLHKFKNEFKTGFWAGDAVAEITINILIRNTDGHIAFAKLFSGQGKVPNIQLASGENARVALDNALENVMAQLFEDTSFTDTLVNLKKTPAPPATAASPVSN